MAFFRFNLNIFLLEALFYAVSFITAILSTIKINKIIAAQSEIARRIAVLPPGQSLILPPDLAQFQQFNAPELITVGQFIGAFLFATLFFIILLKTKHGAGLLRFIFWIAVFAGMQIIFRIWFSQDLSIILAFIFVFIRYLFPRVIVHNFVIIAAITGITINLGINIKPSEALLILVVVSVYDFIAVYVTGHMVRMFKSSVSLGTIFAMIIPADFRHLLKKTSDVNKIKSLSADANLQNAFVYLGGGDLAFPLILVVSSSLQIGLKTAIFTSVGALIGLAALNIIFMTQKERKPMAALPPLAVFTILGFLASLIKF